MAVFAISYFAVIYPQKKEQKRYEEIRRAYCAQKYEEYEQENQTFADYEVDVAFIGDSLTDRYDLENYYPQYITANRGINGYTLDGGHLSHLGYTKMTEQITPVLEELLDKQ